MILSAANTALTSLGGGGVSLLGVVKQPESYGARRNGRRVFDGAMTGGQATLTCSTSQPFTSDDVGKAVLVAGAGVAGNALYLSTTITGYTSPSVVTLNASANQTVSSKLVVWGTDDAAAIQAANDAVVTACVASESNYGVLQFTPGPGFYVASRATVKGGVTRGNTQVPLLNREPSSGGKITTAWVGGVDAGAWMHWQQPQGQVSGAVIYSTLVGQDPDGTWGAPSVVGGPTASLVGGGEFSNIRVVLDGVSIVTPINPSLIAMDLRRAAQMHVKSFTVLADGTAAQLNGSATDDGGVGLYAPMINNNDAVVVEDYSCEGFYYGLGFADHLVALRLGIIYSNTAIFINAQSGTYVHGATIVNASIEAAQTCIEKTNSTDNRFPIWVGCIHTETLGGTAIKDPANNLHGYIGFASNTGSNPTVTGCKHCKVENVNLDRGNIAAPALPASTVASTPIFKDMLLTWSGGTITAVEVDGVVTGLTTPGTIVVPCGKSYSMTYSVAPTTRTATLL